MAPFDPSPIVSAGARHASRALGRPHPHTLPPTPSSSQQSCRISYDLPSHRWPPPRTHVISYRLMPSALWRCCRSDWLGGLSSIPKSLKCFDERTECQCIAGVRRMLSMGIIRSKSHCLTSRFACLALLDEIEILAENIQLRAHNSFANLE